MTGTADELDRRIITELTAQPRRAYAELGKQLGVSGTTVSSRVERLRREGLLSFEVRPDLDAFGFTVQILAAVEVNPAALADVTAMLRASPNILRLDHITGGFNIHLIAAFRTETEVGGLLRQLQTANGVRRVVVQHVTENVRLADGWAAVLARADQPDPPAYGMVPGVQVPGVPASGVSGLGASIMARNIALAGTPRKAGPSRPNRPAPRAWRAIAIWVI